MPPRGRRLRRRERQITDLWQAVVSEVRPDLRANEVVTLVAGIMPFINIYPQQRIIPLPDPGVVSPLVRTYVLGGSR